MSVTTTRTREDLAHADRIVDSLSELKAWDFLALLKPIERDLEIYARRLVWDVADAPDALQNAVMRAFTAFDRYHEDASFRAWMFKILTHEGFALNRKHARIARHEFQLEPDDLADLSFSSSPGAGSPTTPWRGLAKSISTPTSIPSPRSASRS